MDGYTPGVEQPPLPGLIAGRYRSDNFIGRGGMAEVFGGVDLRLQRPVAVKLLRPQFVVVDEVRRRFETEARAAAQLVHPNVVAVFDTGEIEDGDVPYIVMECVNGTTLADEFARGAMPVDRLVPVMVDVLAALGAAHAAGIIHRDVKPANVLLSSDGNGGAKVADFGIAKSLESSAEHTATGGVIGTPAYLSPERIQGEPATPQADIYSVGVMLYEGLAGEKPFRGTSAIEVATAVLERRLIPLRERCPDVSPALLTVVDKAMAATAVDRYPTAAAMSTALTTAMTAPDAADATLLAVPAPVDPTLVLPAAAGIGAFPVATSAPALVSKPERRRAVGAAAIAAGLLLLGVLVAAAQLAGGRSGADSPTSPSTTTAARVTTPPTAPPTTTTIAPESKDGDEEDGGDKKGKGRDKDDDD